MTFVLFGSLIGINILGYFFCMGEYSEIDRRRGRFLFPDNVYLLIALFGGLLGVWKGMRDFHLFRESKLRDLINLMVFLIFSVAFLIGRIMDSRQP